MWLKARARRELQRGVATAKKWWVKKYQAPPKPFHKYTMTELLIEMYTDLYQQRDEVQRELETRRGDKADLYEHLAVIDQALQDETEPQRYSSDPLIDKWERELAEGKEIDLEEQWVG
jgi:hypothetical protein